MKSSEFVVARATLAAVFAWDLSRQAFAVHGIEPTWWLPVCALAGVALAVAGLRFGAPSWPLLLAVACGALVFATHRRVIWPDEKCIFSGAMLTAWALGRLGARWLLREPSARTREGFGLTAATAILGACYVSAALSKLADQGLGWMDPDVVRRAMADYQDPNGPWPLTQWIVDSRPVAGAIAIYTIVIELGGVLFLARGRLRRVAAAGIFTLHVGIALASPIFFGSAMVLVLVFGFVPAPEFGTERVRVRWRAPAALAAAALVVALAVTGAHSSSTMQLPKVQGELLTSLGEIRSGGAIAPGWTVARIERAEDGAVVWLDKSGVIARIELWRTGTRHAGSALVDHGVALAYVCAPSEYEALAPALALVLAAVPAAALPWPKPAPSAPDP